MQTADKNQKNRKMKNRRVNVRTPEVMPNVQMEVEAHYRSRIVEKFRQSSGRYTIGNTSVILAKEFGFCYGVERAIDLAYATRQVFPQRRIFLIGEIIHNIKINNQLQKMGIMNLAGDHPDATINDKI